MTLSESNYDIYVCWMCWINICFDHLAQGGTKQQLVTRLQKLAKEEEMEADQEEEKRNKEGKIIAKETVEEVESKEDGRGKEEQG